MMHKIQTNLIIFTVNKPFIHQKTTKKAIRVDKISFLV